MGKLGKQFEKLVKENKAYRNDDIAGVFNIIMKPTKKSPNVYDHITIEADSVGELSDSLQTICDNKGYKDSDILTIKQQTEVFTSKQIARIDEVENAAYEFCKILTDNPQLEWNMSYIGPIADMASDILVSQGYNVYYPAVVFDEKEDGGSYVTNYHYA